MIIWKDLEVGEMATWQDYKKYVKSIDEDNRHQMEAIEMMTEVVNAMVHQRNELGLTQKQLAELCDMPQSSVARIETFKTSPTLETLMKLMDKLHLRLSLVPV